MSIVIPTPDCYQTVRKAVGYLRAQTVRDRLELVFVVASEESLGLIPEEVADFHSYQVREVGPFSATGTTRAAGLRCASAPVVAFGEDHAFPEERWAEFLLEAHRGPYAAVGPALVNANPDTGSWVSMLLDFGPWIEASGSGLVNRLPWHNTSYKRDILLNFQDRLAGFLEVEGPLHEELRRNGHQLYLEARARIHHVNISGGMACLRAQFHGGRRYAGVRWATDRARWIRRLAYAGAAGLLPLVRLRRAFREWKRIGRQPGLTPSVFFLLLAAAVVASFGECAGYLFGPGSSPEKFGVIEFHRNAAAAGRGKA